MVEQFSLEQITLRAYLIVFVFGVMISFSPCVYPILPVLVSYFGGTKHKTPTAVFLRALSYVCGMSVVYAALGALAALTGGMFGVLQNSRWVQGFVGAVFVIMGLWMLDIIRLPQKQWIQVPPALQRAGFFGPFFVGAVSGLVIGPCTTPVLGAILAFVASKQNIPAGITLLLVYSLGMGLPLLIIATFAGMMRKLPQAGPWMIWLERVFGIILLVSGVYFLMQMGRFLPQ